MTLLESRIRNTFWLEMSGNDRSALRDIVYSLYDIVELPDNELRTIFNRIPFEDVLDAIKYGFSDTEVRESTASSLTLLRKHSNNIS